MTTPQTHPNPHPTRNPAWICSAGASGPMLRPRRPSGPQGCCRHNTPAWCSSRRAPCSPVPRTRCRTPVAAARRDRDAPTPADDGEALRRKVKHLTRLFYGSSALQVVASGGASASDAAASQRRPPQLTGATITGLPLWRVEWCVLPGMQEILHVLAPHYVHMFEGVFARPRPWLFGHLLLPGGSRSLGTPSHALTSGSQAPLVGVLMQVTRAVRLRDGKFLVLATALGRFQVVRAVRELPFSTADVALLEDMELLEPHSQAATAAVMKAADTAAAADGGGAWEPADAPAVMAASAAAAREAAAAAHYAWMQGYELTMAQRQEWKGPGPREGESDMETYMLVQELAEQGVAEVVLPLPDGAVIGRCNLQQVGATAQAAAHAACDRAAAELVSRQRAQQQQQAQAADGSDTVRSSSVHGSSEEASASSSQEAEGVITSLNTTVQRGIAIQAPEFQHLTSSSASTSSVADVLLLEAAVWAQLDILASLSARVKGARAHSLPFGLLQLRPPPPQPGMGAGVAAAAAVAAMASTASADANAPGSRGAAGTSSDSSGSSSSSSLQPVTASNDTSVPGNLRPPAAAAAASGAANTANSSSAAGTSVSGSDSSGAAGTSTRPQQGPSSTARYAFAASEGMDVHADPQWPPLRRAARLSWAAALATGRELEQGELRQALLECTSVASRLRFVLDVLQKHAKVLAALAAVKDVQE